MSNFPLIRFKATDTWIPETDIDGTDANESILSEVNGIEFGNGFFENMDVMNSVPLPTNVQADLDNEYEFLSARTFIHSTKGSKTVYILWKGLAFNENAPMALGSLKIYLDNDEILIDEGSYGITYQSKPHHINYNLVNDQLKINLNCKASAPNNTERILNLTLVYLLPVIYVAGGYSRAEGWYLRPRWLGMSDHEIVAGLIPAPTFFPFNGNNNWTGTPPALITGGVFSPYPGVPFPGFLILRRNNSQATPYNDVLEITTIPELGSVNMVFRWASSSPGDYFVLRAIASDGTTYEETVSAPSTTYIFQKLSIVRDYKFLGIKNIQVEVYSSSATTTTFLCIDSIRIEYEIKNKWALVAKYNDGQRALMTFEEGGITNTPTLRLSKNDLDWRIASYEFYTEEEGIYYLAGSLSVPSITNQWVESGNYIEGIFSLGRYTGEERTLNFNYNLPAEARVDNQREIYSEIVHKGRVYFVNNDYRIYQGHISTNLAIQADAFPYDEETGFGYLIADQSKINLALAVSPTNDMVIITNQGFYVYFIQPSGSGVFRSLRLGSGSLTISSIKSLNTTLNGDPTTDGLFWCDNNGVYVYFGGLQPPENLITLTHQRWWANIPVDRKANAIGFYNPAKKEYWLSLGLSGILIFELPFKKFRYLGVTSLVEYMGVGSDGYVLLRTIGNNIFKRSPNASKFNAVLTTHYNTCNYSIDERGIRVAGAPERFNKILQELYLEFGESVSGVNVTMTVIVDNRIVATYLFNTNKKIDKWLAPVGLRFNQVKLKITIPSIAHVKIKEFGFSYVNDHKEPLAVVPIEAAQDGYGYNYGQNYGVGL